MPWPQWRGRYLRIPCILASNVSLDALDGASRDRPLNNADPLSPLETTTLRDYVNRFVRGLYDKSVMQEAIGQRVLISDSLRSALLRGLSRLAPSRASRRILLVRMHGMRR
ncbi:hypothetical protein E4U49_000022 [Claviceps purpurea]|nr:hypothetical protein E4U49_000022 [Claviceps purpurea]